DYDKAIALEQNDEGYYYNRALLYLNIGDIEAALEDYEAALAINPDYALAIWDKALIEMDLELFESALDGFDRVLELSPYSAAIVHKDKGNLYFKMEEWEKSLESFNQSLALDPYYTYAYKGRGSLYTVLGRYDEAEADLRKTLEYAPDDKDALQRLEFLNKKRG
ncbi:MAG: tetratricopeptide repeat protein, partial [Peptococcaceae bacterium]|nr:tetratricopeptide repeat protein [Peptococcaceae bacterium]